MGTALEEAGRRLWINGERYRKAPSEMQAIWRDLPRALTAAVHQGFALTEQFTKLQLIDTSAPMDLAQECTVAYSRSTSRRGAVP